MIKIKLIKSFSTETKISEESQFCLSFSSLDASCIYAFAYISFIIRSLFLPLAQCHILMNLETNRIICLLSRLFVWLILGFIYYIVRLVYVCASLLRQLRNFRGNLIIIKTKASARKERWNEMTVYLDYTVIQINTKNRTKSVEEPTRHDKCAIALNNFYDAFAIKVGAGRRGWGRGRSRGGHT